MSASTKPKAKARRSDKRKVWITVSGKRMQTTARVARIVRLARGSLKGLSAD